MTIFFSVAHELEINWKEKFTKQAGDSLAIACSSRAKEPYSMRNQKGELSSWSRRQTWQKPGFPTPGGVWEGFCSCAAPVQFTALLNSICSPWMGIPAIHQVHQLFPRSAALHWMKSSFQLYYRRTLTHAPLKNWKKKIFFKNIPHFFMLISPYAVFKKSRVSFLFFVQCIFFFFRF